MKLDKYATFDIETIDPTGKGHFGVQFEVLGLYDGSSYQVFESVSDFITEILRRKYKGFTFYAHNGGRFDFLFLLEELIRRNRIQSIINAHSRIIAIECNANDGKVLFADSYCIMGSPLRELAKSFNVEMQKGAIDYSQISKKDADTLAYLKRDCMALHQVIGAYTGALETGERKLTTASQALDVFRKKYLHTYLQPLPRQLEDTFRERFYAGGRVEVFKGYGEKLNYYDVNSLYPYAMLQDMPVGGFSPTNSFHEDFIGFYDVEILTAPQFYVPPFLVKASVGNVFVNGRGRCFLSSTTLKFLRSQYGVTFRVHGGYYWRRNEPIFREYVEHYYELKRTSTGAIRQIAKLLQNGLYGKTGQRRTMERIEIANGYQDGAKLVEGYYMLVTREEESRSRFILPHLASYVTEMARLRHWQLIQEHESDVHYIDTDSIITTAIYPTSEKLGDLKLEGHFAEGVFLLPKTYALKSKKEEKIVFKGFDARKFTFREMVDASHSTTPLTETRERVGSLKESMKKSGAVVRSGPFTALFRVTKSVKTNTLRTRLQFKDSRSIFDTKAFTFQNLPQKKE